MNRKIDQNSDFIKQITDLTKFGNENFNANNFFLRQLLQGFDLGFFTEPQFSRLIGLKLKGKSRHGKNTINIWGNDWRVNQLAETVFFSPNKNWLGVESINLSWHQKISTNENMWVQVKDIKTFPEFQIIDKDFEEV